MAKAQSGEDEKKYSDLVEKIQSMKNYDADNFIKNISELFTNFKSEEKV